VGTSGSAKKETLQSEENHGEPRLSPPSRKAPLKGRNRLRRKETCRGHRGEKKKRVATIGGREGNSRREDHHVVTASK